MTRAYPARLVGLAILGMAVDIGLARFTYGITLPAIRTDLALDYTWAGALGSIHLAAYLAGTFATPSLAARFGQPRLARAGHLLFAAGALLSAAASGIPSLAIGRLLSGLGAAAGINSVIVLSLEAVAPRLRGPTSAAIWAGIGLAVLASGAAAPTLLAPAPFWQAGWRLAFIVSAALALLLVATFPPRPYTPHPAPPEPGPARADGPWPALIAAYTAYGAGYIAYATFAGARLAALGSPPGLVRAVWLVFALALITGCALVARARRLPHATSLLFALSTIGAALTIGTTQSAALAGAALVGLSMSAAPSIITAKVRQRCPAHRYARMFAITTAGLGFGQLLSPLLVGPLADRFGPLAIPLSATLAYAAAAAFAYIDERATPTRVA